MDIRNCIAELLTVHDCVIIPGFGGFIGNYAPASIDPVYHAFRSPCKKILFNINLKQNDGLLANAIAGAQGTSYGDACMLVELFADECRKSLMDGKAVVIPAVGQLFLGKEGNIQFEQDKNFNLLPDSFGLSSFISPPVTRTTSIIGRDQTAAAGTRVHPGNRQVMPLMIRRAAILALPLGIAAVIGLTQYNRLSSDTTSNANILGSVFSRFSSAALVGKKTAPARQKVCVQPVAAKPAAPQTAPAPELPAATVSDDSFAVIVGAFRMKENAEHCVAALKRKGLDASIFDRSKSGLYRVTIGTSSQRQKADELLAQAKSTDFRDAWLLAK